MPHICPFVAHASTLCNYLVLLVPRRILVRDVITESPPGIRFTQPDDFEMEQFEVACSQSEFVSK